MSEIIWDREENKRLDKILSARFQDLTKLENTIGYYWVEADDKENARKAVIELEALETNLEQVEANYDALQTPMPCGHLARYAVNEEEGTQYCALCVLEADRQTITNLVMVDVEETNEKCPFCQTRAILTRVEELLDLTPEIGSKHYDDVIADLINGASSAKSTFQCYCEETNHE